MAIITKSHNGTSTKHAGRVIGVRTFESRRNMSDTLDYSDWQTVKCVEATVYLGRTAEDGSELPIERRFTTVDCSNHFTWRGADHRTPAVDAFPLTRELHEDLIELDLYHQRGMERELREEQRRKEKRIQAQRKRSRRVAPVTFPRGTAVRVVKGTNAGCEGVVAFVSQRSGKALVKPASQWQDRNADGVWASANQLEATG